MVALHDVIRKNLKYVRVVCCDGDTYTGKCYVYSEMDDNDEIEEYITINNVHIPLKDIKEITEITGG